MKEILMSIQARHNRNIEAGIKRSELRKRIPKCNYPIKVYTYESGFDGRHKVVNEWICRTSTEWRICMGIPAHLPKRACVSVEEIREYSGKNYDNITEMEISDLKIYDKPKELWEFTKCHKCEYGPIERCNRHEFSCDGTYKIINPPQSWCYVEALK